MSGMRQQRQPSNAENIAYGIGQLLDVGQWSQVTLDKALEAAYEECHSVGKGTLVALKHPLPSADYKAVNGAIKDALDGALQAEVFPVGKEDTDSLLYLVSGKKHDSAEIYSIGINYGNGSPNLTLNVLVQADGISKRKLRELYSQTMEQIASTVARTVTQTVAAK